MILQLIVLSVLTTFTFGNARRICSPSESVLHTDSVGGMPLLKSNGLAISRRTLPLRLAAPARFRASTDAAPFVQLNSVSPNRAASANVPWEALGPLAWTQVAAFALFWVRDPIITSWPSCTSFVPIVVPTIPVPSTPSFMFILHAGSGRTRSLHDLGDNSQTRRRAREMGDGGRATGYRWGQTERRSRCASGGDR